MNTKISDIKKLLLKDINFGLKLSIDSFKNKDLFLDEVASSLNKSIKLIYLCQPKDIKIREFIAVAKKIRQLCSIFNALLIIESRADLAEIIDAHGIYINENDIDISDIKKIIHDEKLICTSYNAYQEGLKDIDFLVNENKDQPNSKAILDALNLKIINIAGDFNNEYNC